VTDDDQFHLLIGLPVNRCEWCSKVADEADGCNLAPPLIIDDAITMATSDVMYRSIFLIYRPIPTFDNARRDLHN